MPIPDYIARTVSTGFSEKLHGHTSTSDRNETRVLQEILQEVKAIRKHLDRSRWLGPEGEVILRQITKGK